MPSEHADRRSCNCLPWYRWCKGRVRRLGYQERDLGEQARQGMKNMKNNTNMLIKYRLVVMTCLLLAGWMGYAYWQTRNLDPEGGCKDTQYFSLCFNAWSMTWFGFGAWDFKRLPTDEEMIERFKVHRLDFETMKNKLLENFGGFIMDEKSETGVYWGDRFASYPLTQDEKIKHISRDWGYEFRVADTRYVKDATSQDLSMLLRTKGYVYFRSPPQVENGYVQGFPYREGETARPRWRLLPSLNGPPWPEDWKSEHCWLRQIEPQWFLSLCRDQVGG